MTIDQLMKQSEPFLSYVLDWVDQLKPVDLEERLASRPERAVLASIDLVNGFCHEGALASSRVAGIVDPVVALFQRAHQLGVQHYLLLQDTHHPDALEFNSYPPHCVRGTSESQTVPELKVLPFSEQFRVMPKNCIDTSVGTELIPWIGQHLEVDTYIVVGDCTDICIYELAIQLRARAYAFNRQVQVIVPENCTQTYDLPVAVAREIGAVPHDGDLLHLIFLYSMMLNGVEIVSSIR